MLLNKKRVTSMRYHYYLQEGIVTDSLPKGYNKFYITERVDTDSDLNRYCYIGDGILYELDSLCVDLYDVFQDAIFPSRDEFYKDYGIQPQWISRAGLDSDFDMPKDELVECFETPIQDRMAAMGLSGDGLLQSYTEIEAKKYKYAYVSDCQSLINTLQELLLGCQSAFIGYYKHLCSLRSEPAMEGTYYECSAESRMVFSFLYSLIIQIYSSFDVLTKIAYELENLVSSETSYAKLASRKTLFGSRKKLKMNISGTVFERCKTTSIIENLRDELVHNAVWDMNPKVFCSSKNGMIIERYIFMPDLTAEGTLVTYKNRKRFFSEGKRVNDVLPELYFDVLQRVYVTLLKLVRPN